MNGLPLISGADPQRLVMRRGTQGLRQGPLLAAAARLAAQLPDRRWAINLCESRVEFLVSFLAALLRGQTTLLPSSAGGDAIAQLQRGYAGSYRIADRSTEAEVQLSEALLVGAEGGTVVASAIDPEHLAVILFTSGSTGAPQPHGKRWHECIGMAQCLSQRIGLRGTSVVATVPAQHMFGFETTVLSALHGGAVVDAARPFYPQDIREALRTMPEPRLLVSTPLHLRTLLESGVSTPPVARILSATAPMPTALAAQLELHFDCEVQEVFGCTEAGSLASRRSAREVIWSPYPGVRFEPRTQGVQVTAEHLVGPVVLSDRVETQADGGFHLLGRDADLVKIAGKRISLEAISEMLLAIPGVIDAAVLMPEGEALHLRPAALVVAPELSVAQIRAQLAQQLDPIFVPRPLRRVEQLPRNALGKLPRAALLALLDRSA
jgi:acyl-coenzyme A synthetase/AMP-(fatty) acid ligase